MDGNTPDQEHVTRFGVEELRLSESHPVHVFLSKHSGTTRAPKLDMHYALEIGVVLDGRMRRWVGHETSSVARGDVWLCGMWEVHGYSVAQAPCDTLIFVVWPPLLSDLRLAEAPNVSWIAPFGRPWRQRPRIKETQRAEFVALAQRIAGYAAAPDASQESPADRLALRLALMEILFELYRQSPEPFRRSSISTANKETIAPALELALSARKLVTLRQAAGACGLSRDRFARQFHALMGMHFAPFALYRRLGGAAREMITSDEPIKAIASGWGFTDESHFHRHFRRHYGTSPAAYRREHNAALT